MAGSDGSVAMSPHVLPHVLIVAGSDSSGGAGIVRDVETVSAFGLRACVAITAVTVQTHQHVARIEQMPPDLVAEQMRAAFAANPVAAVKIGMLGSLAMIDAVSSVLASSLPIPVVLDPVIASTSGRQLLATDAVDALKRKLFALCALVTPNLPELALLSGLPLATGEGDIPRQAGKLFDAGAQAVLVKGGHATGTTATDLLVLPGHTPIRFDAPRLTGTMRGTGCMLASAISAHLALGESLETSIGLAKRHVFARLLASSEQGR
ncbi:hydroxymethylpyrimidine/phosphomethylpyrimidine kinase [Aminobacter anthyllidis]|uniref:hydroxymethylpyrimidine kinase n=1 Tax=Aminobacter anthyllidis TaxID=1035067 RepID=A0A9X1D524_9HYPH|nr:hydroxymethylpyrimidine/phosphomethylpyrimidine kinase [Aminobacter anthyllidis]MBT1157425.1 hydroxymethylpyrimidine/phosphomethylpyrimidine kinase [Aminobacter anthyllidis]